MHDLPRVPASPKKFQAKFDLLTGSKILAELAVFHCGGKNAFLVLYIIS